MNNQTKPSHNKTYKTTPKPEPTTKINKRQLINYLVDVLGMIEEEGKKVASVYGTSYLTERQIKECIAFSQ